MNIEQATNLVNQSNVNEKLGTDYAFISAFGTPMRDSEQLSWDGLKFCPYCKRIVLKEVSN